MHALTLMGRWHYLEHDWWAERIRLWGVGEQPEDATLAAPGTESMQPADAQGARTTRIEDLLVGEGAPPASE